MSHKDVIAKCPFYMRENQVTIYCESNVILGGREKAAGYYAHIFKNATEKTKYMRAHCVKYPDMNCPYADFMERVFEGGKQNEVEKEMEAGEDRDREPEGDHKRVGEKKQISVRLM